MSAGRWSAQNDASVDDFDQIRTVGMGAFGRVMLVQHRVTKEYHAMKILARSKVATPQLVANVN